MSRRSNEEISSLDLLLDTICNAFGGIVFIALLMAILTQATSDTIKADAKEERQIIDALKATEAVAILSNIVEELNGKLKTINSSMPEAEGTNTQMSLLMITAENEALQAIVNDITIRADELAGKAASVRDQMIALGDEVDTARKAISRLTAEKNKSNDPPVMRRLPVVRGGMDHLKHIHLIVAGGKLFLIESLGASSGTTHPSVIEHVVPDAWVYEPNYPLGQPIGPGCERAGIMKYVLDNSISSQSVLRFMVDTQSFAEFNYLKEFAVSRGYRYHLSVGGAPHFFTIGKPSDAM